MSVDYQEEINRLNEHEQRARQEIAKETDKKGSLFWVIISTCVVLTLWFCGMFFPYIIREFNQHGYCEPWGKWFDVPSTEEIELMNWGLVGDSFGVVNALFSGLAFAFVIVALVLQSRELKLQRLEMNLGLIESARSRIEQIRMAEAQRNSEQRLQDQAELMAVAASISALSTIDSRIGDRLSATNLNNGERFYLNTTRQFLLDRIEYTGLKMDGRIEAYLDLNPARFYSIRL